MSKSAFQEHHIISRDLADSDPLLRALKSNGYFDVDEDINLIELPSTRELAEILGTQTGLPTSSVSPHRAIR